MVVTRIESDDTAHISLQFCLSVLAQEHRDSRCEFRHNCRGSHTSTPIIVIIDSEGVLVQKGSERESFSFQVSIFFVLGTGRAETCALFPLPHTCCPYPRIHLAFSGPRRSLMCRAMDFKPLKPG